MEKKNVTSLADEYAHSIELLDRLIAECRKSLKHAQQTHRYAVVSKLNSNLAEFYRQRRELVEVQNHLRRYYSSKEDKKAG